MSSKARTAKSLMQSRQVHCLPVSIFFVNGTGENFSEILFQALVDGNYLFRNEENVDLFTVFDKNALTKLVGVDDEKGCNLSTSINGRASES